MTSFLNPRTQTLMLKTLRQLSENDYTSEHEQFCFEWLEVCLSHMTSGDWQHIVDTGTQQTMEQALQEHLKKFEKKLQDHLIRLLSWPESYELKHYKKTISNYLSFLSSPHSPPPLIQLLKKHLERVDAVFQEPEKTRHINPYRIWNQTITFNPPQGMAAKMKHHDAQHPSLELSSHALFFELLEQAQENIDSSIKWNAHQHLAFLQSTNVTKYASLYQKITLEPAILAGVVPDDPTKTVADMILNKESLFYPTSRALRCLMEHAILQWDQLSPVQRDGYSELLQKQVKTTQDKPNQKSIEQLGQDILNLAFTKHPPTFLTRNPTQPHTVFKTLVGQGFKGFLIPENQRQLLQTSSPLQSAWIQTFQANLHRVPWTSNEAKLPTSDKKTSRIDFSILSFLFEKAVQSGQDEEFLQRLLSNKKVSPSTLNLFFEHIKPSYEKVWASKSTETKTTFTLSYLKNPPDADAMALLRTFYKALGEQPNEPALKTLAILDGLHHQIRSLASIQLDEDFIVKTPASMIEHILKYPKKEAGKHRQQFLDRLEKLYRLTTGLQEASGENNPAPPKLRL